MIIAPQSIALAADDSSQASAVSLISDGFSVDKKAIYAGDTFKLKYTIKNTNSKLDVKNLNMRLHLLKVKGNKWYPRRLQR